MRQFVSSPPVFSSSSCVCFIGFQPPSVTSWSSVSEKTMLGQSLHGGPCTLVCCANSHCAFVGAPFTHEPSGCGYLQLQGCGSGGKPQKA